LESPSTITKEQSGSRRFRAIALVIVSILVAGLPPRNYRLEAEAPGFKKLTIERVIAAVDLTTEALNKPSLPDPSIRRRNNEHPAPGASIAPGDDSGCES
jgi:hypothetical protein